MNKEDIDDIFNINTDGVTSDESGGSDDGGYAHVKKKKTGTNFKDEIEKADQILQTVPSRSIQSKIKKDDVIVSNSSAGIHPLELHEEIKVAKKKSEKLDESDEDDGMSPLSSVDWSHTPLDGEWRLSHHDLKFSSFYDLKSRCLSQWLLPGGRLKFKELQDELRNSKINLSDVVFGDVRNLFAKMRDVQMLKDRVIYITNCCNEQYYPWKRAVDMLEGALAQAEYLKPAQRQKGLNAEHLGDMIKYLSQLESLHAVSENTFRNLESVYEMLSRQVTMCMPQIRDEAISDKYKQKSQDNDAGMGAVVSFLDKMDTVTSDSVPSKKTMSQISKSKTGSVDW